MTALAKTTVTARFGAFELNLRSGELRKGGIRVRLQQQPFVVLSALLENPGQLVTREELQKRLWPDGRFVDYEDGLATAVKKVRRALSDVSTAPRFVETLPKRGYRFLAPVEFVESPPLAVPSQPAVVEERRLVGWGWSAVGMVVAAMVTWVLLADRPVADETIFPAPVALTRDSGVTADPAVSADGKWLVYASDRDGGDDLDIWVQPMPLGSAKPIQITDNPGHELRPDVSPDGRLVAWEDYGSSPGRIYVTSLPDLEARYVGRGVGPRFSPDGEWIATRYGALMRVDGGSILDLALGTSIGGGLTWAPDSKRLVVATKPDPEGVSWLDLVPIDGGERRRVDIGALSQALGRPARLIHIRWASDTGGIVAGVQGTSDIWHLKFSEDWTRIAEVERIASLAPSQVQYPNLVRGRLVFGVRSTNMDLAALPLDPETGRAEGEIERLTDDPMMSRNVDASATGTRISYAGETANGAMRAWLKDVGTGEAFVIDDRLMPADGVVISADGFKVAFTGLEGGPGERYEASGGSRQSPDLYVHDVPTRTTRKVCRGCGIARDWSPDGRSILTTIDRPGAANTAMWIVDSTTGERRLLANGLRGPFPTFTGSGSEIVFSDFDRIVAASLQDGRLADKRKWRVLASNEGARTRFPVVSSDEQTLYFTSDKDGYWCIWARRLDRRSGRPTGETFAVQHFHRFQSSMTQSWGSRLTIAPGKLLFNWREDSGNIWMVEPSDNR